MKKQLKTTYEEIVGLENLYFSWQEFLRGKRDKKDVREFGLNLSENLIKLNEDLENFKYRHGPYAAFKISDPKPRDIHKATVRDRVLHHAAYRKISKFFNIIFIADSYSCQVNKGAHKTIKRFRVFGFKVSRNNTKTTWVLKCDVRKFFANIDHKILMSVLSKQIPGRNILWLMQKILESFDSGSPGRGLPLGNLTSQLFCNIYMNEFDQFVKHKLRAKHYIRYADDFCILSNEKRYLENLIPEIAQFLKHRLKLELHPNKVFIKTLASGVDFLGWVHSSDHRVLRTITRKRAFRRIKKSPKESVMNSYLGLISHGNTFGLKQELINWYGLCGDPYSNL